MRSCLVALAALGLSLVAAPAPSFAQGAAPAETQPAARGRSTRAQKREPTAGQMAARERQKKCGAEWREAKTKGSTGGLKWPQFYSRCNARLKGGQA